MHRQEKLFTAETAESADKANKGRFRVFRAFRSERLSLLGLRMCVVLVAAGLSQGCLVVSLHPAYDDETIAWEEGLIGQWRDAEDNVEVTITPGEWRSYRVHYKHPVEEADFTGRLTIIGDSHFLDLMPPRGQDYGAVLVPAHLVVKISRDGNRWQVSALDYDGLRAAIKRGQLSVGLATFDQRQNVVLTSSTTSLRAWLRSLADKDFDAPATFERMDP